MLDASNTALVLAEAISHIGGKFMRNLLALVGAAVATFVGVGWYLGWFSVHKIASDNGKASYSVEIDKGKIESDLHRGEAKLHGMLEKNTDENPPVLPPPPPLDSSNVVTAPVKDAAPPTPFE